MAAPQSKIRGRDAMARRGAARISPGREEGAGAGQPQAEATCPRRDPGFRACSPPEYVLWDSDVPGDRPPREDDRD
jgi:hypothetical protein